VKVRPTFWVGLLLIVGSYLAAMTTNRGANLLFFRLSYFFLGWILISWGWALISVRGLRVKRYVRYLRQQVGQIFEERFEVENSSRWTRLWVEVRDEGNLLSGRSSKVLSIIGPFQQRSYISRRLLLQRGEFMLGPTRLISGDPFGLFQASRLVLDERMLLVLPYWVRLERWVEPPGMLAGGRARRIRSLEVSSQAAGVREYMAGDPLSRIHWKTTARKERLMVKEFEQDPQADVWIFLDADRSVHVQESGGAEEKEADLSWMWMRRYDLKLPAHTFEYAISAVASAADYYLRQGRTVGLVCAGQTNLVLSAERGERQLNKILEALALIRCDGNLSVLGMIQAQGHLQRGSTAVVATASTQDGVALAAELLMQRDIRPVMVLVDTQSFHGPAGTQALAARLRAKQTSVAVLGKDRPLADELLSALER
jgi:uncharacterized protein (DUF58 family)